MSLTVIIAAAGAVCALCVLSSMRKSEHFIKYLFLSSVEGIAALFAVNAAGTFTGVTLSVNPLTLISGAVFGVPGVAAHIVIQIIAK